MPDATNTPHVPSIRGLRRRPRAYDRDKDLPVLLTLWPGDLFDVTTGGRLAVLAKLRRALRQERKRGETGHWSYDLARHAALRNAYRAEVAATLKLSPNLSTEAEPSSRQHPV